MPKSTAHLQYIYIYIWVTTQKENQMEQSLTRSTCCNRVRDRRRRLELELSWDSGWQLPNKLCKQTNASYKNTIKQVLKTCLTCLKWKGSIQKTIQYTIESFVYKCKRSLEIILGQIGSYSMQPNCQRLCSLPWVWWEAWTKHPAT